MNAQDIAPSRNGPLLKRRVALFDSDCLEVAGEGSLRSRELPDFGIRARVQPLAGKLDRLYAFARRHDLITVFTHCCDARIVKPGAHPEVLVVPMDGSDGGWVQDVGRFRLINIQKHNAAPLRESFICRHFDMFQHNSNARRLLRILDIPQWVVFGHGFDLCVDSAVKGIVSAGYGVHVLTDVIASSATGYGPYGTEESKRSILEYLMKIGVTTGTLDAYLGEHDR
jgi:hypothetical protein